MSGRFFLYGIAEFPYFNFPNLSTGITAVCDPDFKQTFLYGDVGFLRNFVCRENKRNRLFAEDAICCGGLVISTARVDEGRFDDDRYYGTPDYLEIISSFSVGVHRSRSFTTDAVAEIRRCLSIKCLRLFDDKPIRKRAVISVSRRPFSTQKRYRPFPDETEEKNRETSERHSRQGTANYFLTALVVQTEWAFRSLFCPHFRSTVIHFERVFGEFSVRLSLADYRFRNA